ncbi:DNA-binding MarR family transcriptional regulator [Saccharomonospora amisosensis]|uniref:DNA-binding MarR family transcriptional regulator n=1 Tax=Saccharomonospora amisosensis TaxID=1128677 RepID=A0A7X5UTI1_9PSEU|nr:MarR family winged helix-turn-helix transcriptional regulator [Saccharomonospora amisosensis]NIJ13845.1 DNA-binding MarR family transcriptional regulator [Saccharomonospora amisosensis]
MQEGAIPALLAMAFRAVMDRVHEQLAGEGFTDVRPAHGFVFQYLSTHPAATAVELGEHLGITKQAAVQLVDELDRRGYVERRPHPHDRRSRVVALTPRGWHCIRRVVEAWTGIEQEWARLIGTERLRELHDDLVTLTDHTGDGRRVPLRPVW